MGSGDVYKRQLFHGSPRDPVWEYVLTMEQARAALEVFSDGARTALEWTREAIGRSGQASLQKLSPEDTGGVVPLFHGSPRDPVWEYVLSAEQAGACFDVQPARIALIGHAHVALFFVRPAAEEQGNEIRGAQSSDDTLLDLAAGCWLINPGSVGQPRDGDPRAAWLELDTSEQNARFHRVGYDIERAAASISAAGLPRRLANRLRVGS